jgi:hypothetical protein
MKKFLFPSKALSVREGRYSQAAQNATLSHFRQD